MATEQEKDIETQEETVEETNAECPEKDECADEKKEEKQPEKTEEEKLKEQLDESKDKYLRLMAEYDNFRKRSEKEKTAMYEIGAKDIIEKVLPVVDNFERGLATIPEEDKGSGFANGMEMIYRQLMTELEKMDVKPIPAVGEEFNPEFHNAVMQVESEEYESGVVAQELLKGYTYRDTVVRHSMVAVVS